MPAEVRHKKVIVLSHCRSGTLGLYRALQILGFKPYDAYECLVLHRAEHTKVFIEAAVAHYNQLSGIRRLTRADCDKWFADYDAIVEIASLLSAEVLESYAQDPDVKFIPTERDPEKWARSVNNASGKAFQAVTSFPLNVLKYFDGQFYDFIEAHRVTYLAFASGTRPADPDNKPCSANSIPTNNRSAPSSWTKMAWSGRTFVLFWDSHKQDYPDRNQPAHFQALFEAFIKPRIATAAMKCGVVAVSVVGVRGWTGFRYGSSALTGLKKVAGI
ncbi:hypothetical protein N7492_008579 [Penicillium capsulatum]|uniref:Uncharacterized protein n=1 Tax=Penicillium capsulatum TaxID=69766 RepID=A0A9W9HQZ5_9EURO|nr:hypothetical protein N7492_008579 [Penicillium capsulatum]KAJ6105984.1 hypothetical protein N7512_009501 [Penicillium capsulatum]